MSCRNSKDIYLKGIKYIPGGVNSPVRAFKSVGRENPIFIKKGEGAYVIDEEDKRYIDYIGSWGPMILGHNHKNILEGVRETIENGSSFGLPTKMEIELAQLITDSYPSMEMVRLTTSGTEATMSAIRVARAYTNRNKIIKFDGCYHGHSDALLVKSGSGLLTQGFQDSNGITKGVLEDTIVLKFGEYEELEKRLEKKDIACVIIEPIPANMGVILTEKKYLQFLREICDKTGTLLIFDEVITGFRLALGGACEYFGVAPDIATLGKIIGGGYPVGAFGGKKEIMELIAPVGRVYHAGTLSGNPVSVRAGYETIKYLSENRNIYRELEEKTLYLATNIKKLAQKYEIDVVVNSIASLYTVFFTKAGKVTSLEEALSSDTEKFKMYFNTMLENGIVCPPSQFEAHFVSLAHTEKELEYTLKIVEKAFEKIKNEQ